MNNFPKNQCCGIRIIWPDPDPYRENGRMDPELVPERIRGAKKNYQKYKNIIYIYYIIFKKINRLFWLIYMNNKLINTKKNHGFEYHIFD